ncbi:MAG: acyl-CoA thioesterase [Candidatus Azotimanducaceae bacterium]|jgi:acyl-CoA thioesterase
MMSQYDTETAVSQSREHLWTGTLSADWNIGENPNGGYLVSIALNALSQTVDHPDPVSVTTHYLRPGIALQPFEVKIDVLRRGRTLTTARATLIQKGKTCLEVLCVFGNLAQISGVESTISIPAPNIISPDNCDQRSGCAQGIDLPILNRLDTRLQPINADDTPKAEINGWIRFLDGRDADVNSLPLFSDAFPPSVFNVLGVVGWVPTVELTVHVRGRPAPGWIQTQFRTDDLQQGRMIENGLLWDSNGDLVAQSRQIGLVMKK